MHRGWTEKMACIVCGELTDGKDYVTFDCCGHRALRTCVQPWLALPWDGEVVCPRIECRQRCVPCTRLRVEDLKERVYLVIDPTCDHCTMLMHEVGPQFASWEYVGMQAVENTPLTRFGELANESHFPHTYKEMSTGLVSVSNGVADMFWKMAEKAHAEGRGSKVETGGEGQQATAKVAGGHSKCAL